MAPVLQIEAPWGGLVSSMVNWFDSVKGLELNLETSAPAFLFAIKLIHIKLGL